MKSTPILKRIFASLITVATATTLATAGLYQSALAADITIPLDGSSSSGSTPAVAITPVSESDYTDNTTVTVDWNGYTSEGYAYGMNNTDSLVTFSGSIIMNDKNEGGTVNLYTLTNASGATISKISGATISATTDTNSENKSYAYGIYNKGTITAIENGTTITANAYTASYGIHNDSHIDNISGVTISSTGGTLGSYGINNQSGSSIGSISDISITATSSTGPAYGIYNIGSIDSVSGTITANGGTTTYALYGGSKVTAWNFNGNTTLSATGGKTNNYAINSNNSASSLTLKSEDTNGNAANATVSMTGDIYALNASLTMASGNYVLDGTSTTITASNLSISEGASLTLTGDTTFAISDGTLVLNVDTLTAAAMLVITEGANINDLANINVVLSTEAANGWVDGQDLALITAADAELFDGINFTLTDASGTSIDTVSASTFVTSNIPEPSTATLSLLALAGLCARRRRKAA